MRQIIRRSLLLGLMVAAAPWSAHAADDDAAVRKPVEQLIAALLTIMKQGTATPFDRRAETLAPVIDESFDLDTILRASVGATWPSLDPATQGRLGDAFRRYTIASYVHSFDTMNGQRFEIRPEVRGSVNADRLVSTRIIPAKDEPHVLDYLLRQRDGRWRIVDVLAEGTVSRVAVQRSDFRRLLTQGGGVALIENLRQKAQDLSKP